MKLKVLLTGCFALCTIATSSLAQNYNAYGYANGVAGEKYHMPGTQITAASELEVNNLGVVTCYYYDITNLSGPDLKADTGVVFGIYTDAIAKDAGGQDKRGYDTKTDAANSSKYAPIRWNGGSNLWRQGGQWVRYSIDFDSNAYNFVFRSNVNSFAVAAQKFVLKIFEPSNMSTPVFERKIDLSGGLPNEGEIANSILRIGGGNLETDWFKLLDEINLEAATYVVELASPETSYSFSSWGVFTFNKATSYGGKPYTGIVPNATTDTIKAYQYDITGDLSTFSTGDSGVTVGVYNTINIDNGQDIRENTDAPKWDAVRFNSETQTFQANGGWYKYSVSFNDNKPYYFCFRGLTPTAMPTFNGTVQIIEPFTDNVIAEYTINNDVAYYSTHDKTQTTRWMYIKNAASIPNGNYCVKIDFPTIGDTGILGEFTFSSVNPANNTPLVRTFNWPQTVANDNNLHSSLYTVKVHQDDEVYDMFLHKSVPDIRASKYPDDNGGNGVMKELYDRTFNFCQFEYTGEIVVEATKVYGTAATRVEIQPKAYGINPFYFDGRTVKFKLKHMDKMPSYISINFVADDNLDSQPLGGQKAVKHGLMLFGDKPEVYKPDTLAAGTVFYSDDADSAEVVNANLIYFKPGDYNLKKVFKRGVIDLTKNGQHVYLEGGAYVRGTIWTNGKDNIWLYGRGFISGWDMLFHELLDENGRKDAFVNFVGSDNCHIEGISIIDPTHHSIPSSSNTYFKNVKIIGWSYNQDGTRVGSGSYLEEMFTKTQDDRSYADRGQVYKNSVEWPMRNGAFGILGWGSYDGGFATYENIYMINSEWERPENTVGNQAVIGSNIKQGSNQQNDTIRNLSLEDYTTLLCILRINYDPTSGDAWKPSDPGEIKNFYFDNITVEQPFITTNGTKKYNRIEGFIKDGIKATVHDITFRNLVVAGELVLDHNKSKYFYIDPKTTYNIFFESSDTVHTIRATQNAGGSVFPKGDLAVPKGQSQYVSIEPNKGYRIKDVKVDHTSVGPLTVVNLTNVTSDHIIEVEFEAGENTFDLQTVLDPNTVLTDTIQLGVNHIHTAAKNIFAKSINDHLRISPNPTSTNFTLQKANPNAEVIVYNNLGQEVLRTNSKTINVSTLNTGTYIVATEGKFGKVNIIK